MIIERLKGFWRDDLELEHRQVIIRNAIEQIEDLREALALEQKTAGAEIEKLHREAAIRIDQIEREQEAHLKTMADLNKQAEMNGRLLSENASLRADKEQFWSQRNQYKKEYEETVAFATRIRDELTAEIFMLRDKLKTAHEALETEK